jgi:hypothetical protein
MAVSCETHGIARVWVNGFLPGEYNTAANAFTVSRAMRTHGVEVYFPASEHGVTFDQHQRQARPNNGKYRRHGPVEKVC